MAALCGKPAIINEDPRLPLVQVDVTRALGVVMGERQGQEVRDELLKPYDVFNSHQHFLLVRALNVTSRWLH